MNITKMFCLMQHISTFKRIEFKAKSKKPIELIRFFLSCYDDKKYILEDG